MTPSHPARPAMLLVLLLTAGAAAADTRFQGPDLERFLRQAAVRRPPAGRAPGAPHRVVLTMSGLTHEALWTGSRPAPRARSAFFGRPRLDSAPDAGYRSECAAYELDRLLGLGMVPATVERVIAGERGALTVWLEPMMSDAERVERELTPPDAEAWARQLHEVRLFDALIFNTPRSPEALLITDAWEVRLIDHGRAFRQTRTLRDPASLARFSRARLARLRTLDEPLLKRRLGRYLSIWQIRALLERRDRLLDHAAALAAARGEAAVYYP